MSDINPCPFCGGNNTRLVQIGACAYVRCDAPECDVSGPSGATALEAVTKWNSATEARRLTESAREWSGPDRWQYFTAALDYHPDDHDVAMPNGYVQIGPWESAAYIQAGVYDGSAGRYWRRPLRRVQG